MLDCILDGVIDTLKLSPYLLVTFILLEFIEHKLSKKNQKILLTFMIIIISKVLLRLQT